MTEKYVQLTITNRELITDELEIDPAVRAMVAAAIQKQFDEYAQSLFANAAACGSAVLAIDGKGRHSVLNIRDMRGTPIGTV